MKNKQYWAFNLPLQVWPATAEDPEETILNYMPRRESCHTENLADMLGEQTREEFLEQAARILENLARLMRQAAKDPQLLVYYPTHGMEADHA